MSQKLTTSKVRLSYVNVFKPKETKQGDLKYSVTCLLPKSDVKGYKMLMDTINAEFEAEKNGKLKGIASPKNPVHDGDGVSPTGKAYGDECKGHWVFTASASSDYPPAVVDRNVQPIINPTELYSGCYGHVALSIYAYNTGSTGIGFGLNGIQKVEDGEALGHSFSAEDAFSAVADNSDTPFGNSDIDPLTGLPR